MDADLLPPLLSAAILMCLVVISVGIGRTIPAEARLPMQWGIGGKPTWYGGRGLAVWIMPLVALVVIATVLTALAMGLRTDPPTLTHQTASIILAGFGICIIPVHLVFLLAGRRHIRARSDDAES